MGVNTFNSFVIGCSCCFRILATLFVVSLLYFISFHEVSPNTGSGLANACTTIYTLHVLSVTNIRFRGARIITVVASNRRTNLENTGTFTGTRRSRCASNSIGATILYISALASVSCFGICSGSVSKAIGGSGRFSRLILSSSGRSKCSSTGFTDIFFNSSSTTTFSRTNVGTAYLTTVSPTPNSCCRGHESGCSHLIPRTVRAKCGVILSAVLGFSTR